MKGPKGILAEAIAKALSEYFVVDPAHIETNLIRDAGVTLHEVELRPRQERLNQKDCSVLVADIVGTVSQVAFRWKWGSSSKDGGSAWVNSAELTINGLSFVAVLKELPTNPDDDSNDDEHLDTTSANMNTTTPTNGNGKNGGGVKGYIEDQVKRILDTLRLAVTDFEFRLQLPPNQDGNVRSLAFGGAGLNLESYGRKSDTDPLRQELSIANIFSSLLIQHWNDGVGGVDESLTTTTFPLFEPISYKAECTRVVGKRFEGGVQTGLQVRGESTDDGIIVHAGKEQMSFLNDLAGMLIAPKPVSNKEQPTGLKEETKVESKTESSKPVLEECEMNSSFFELPLAALSLVFPNGTKISMADLMVRYQMDGNICLVEGRKGFLVNDFPMLSLGDDGFWQANVVDSRFCISKQDQHDTHDNTTVAYIHARDDEIQNIKNGVNGLLDIYQMMLSDTSGAVASMAFPESARTPGAANDVTTQSSSDDVPSSTWTFDIDGALGFLLEGPNNETIADCWLSQIHANMASKTLTVGSVEKLDIPGSICLTQALSECTMKFDGHLFDIRVGDIVAKLQEPSPSQKPENKPETMKPISSSNGLPTPTNSESSTVPFVLPFGVKAQVSSVKVYETDGTTIHTKLQTLQAALGPDSPQLEGDKQVHSGGVRALLMLEEIHHDMISFANPKLSAVLYPHELGLVQEFDFGADSISVAAGYSVFDWKRLFETGDQNREKKKETKSSDSKGKKKNVVHLPFAHVHPLKVKIAVKGELVGTKGTTMNINAFDGKENTVLGDLIRFYTTRAMTNMPGMFRDADVLGFNVTDTAASQVGTAAGASALGALGGAAAPVAGVLGIVGFDGIKNTIKAGKKSRGVQEDDKMEFGDFFRGIGQAAKDATAAGASKRGKGEQDKADALDWALGATTSTAQYTNENKSRLGGAGAGTVGFAYGMVLGGPVGAVAGALIASRATSSTIDALDSRISNKNKQNGKLSQS